MKLKDIVDLLMAEELFVPDGCELCIKYAGASDLMSDVLAFLSHMPTQISKQMMLITGLVSVQSIRTAGLTDIPLVLFTRGKKPPENVLVAAKTASIAIISTPLTSFTASGLLHAAGVKGVDDEVKLE